MFENARRGRQARNVTKNVPKILALKSSSEQIFSEDCRWVPLVKVKKYNKTVNIRSLGILGDLGAVSLDDRIFVVKVIVNFHH